jgi:hypothetical protein
VARDAIADMTAHRDLVTTSSDNMPSSKRGRPRCWMGLAALLAAAATACGSGSPSPDPRAASAIPSPGIECRTVRLPVVLPNNDRAELSGYHCVPNGTHPVALQLLVHGGTYNHTYWSWSQEPETYNYVNKAAAAKYGTGSATATPPTRPRPSTPPKPNSPPSAR